MHFNQKKITHIHIALLKPRPVFRHKMHDIPNKNAHIINGSCPFHYSIAVTGHLTILS